MHPQPVITDRAEDEEAVVDDDSEEDEDPTKPKSQPAVVHAPGDITGHILTCGHNAHIACVLQHREYLAAQRGDMSNMMEMVISGRAFKGMQYLNGTEYCCPLCSRVMSVLCPYPTSDTLQCLSQRSPLRSRSSEGGVVFSFSKAGSHSGFP